MKVSVDSALLKIRPAVPADVESVAAVLHAAHAWNMEHGFNFTAAYITAEDLAQRMARSRFCVAEVDSKLVGTIEVKIDDKLEGWCFKLLAVDPDCGRKGVGRALVACAEAYAHQQGARQLLLDTPANHPWLPTYYEQLGYRISGEIQWTGKQYRSVIMRKELPSP